MSNSITLKEKPTVSLASEQALRALFDQSPGEEVLSLRSESTKHFKLGGGRFQAITYAEPVHYKDPASGEWQDIDNSLVETVTAAGRRVLRNRANPVQVEFPAETDGGCLVSLSHDGHTFSWRFEKEALPIQACVRSGLQLKHDRLAALALKTPAFVGRTVESINRLSCAELSNALESEQERRGQILNLHSENTYAQVLPGVSVRYTLGSHGVKEDIILDNEAALAHAAIRLPADFRYEVSKSGELLVMEKESGETLFTMSQPFVYDAEAQETFAVPTLTDLGDYVRLEYVLDTDFLASAVFPITIDPVVKTRTINENVNDTYIWAKNPNANYGGVYLMRCGYSYSKEAISLIQLRNLVQIKASHTILSAQLRIGATDYGTAGEIMGCYPIKTPWDETTATWNSMTPTNDTHISKDLVSYIPSTNPQFCYFDISEQYKGWYLLDEQGVSKNYGIALRQPPEINSTSNFVQWASTRYNSSLGPCFIVNYVSHAGRKKWWQYESMSAGRAGSAYVDLFNGNLVFEHADGGTTGLRMPVSISHIYNSCLSESNPVGCGKGWRLNMHQSVRKESIESTNYYIWTDGDGTEHFFKISGSQPYSDEEGMSLKLKTASNKLTITDKGDLKLEFPQPANTTEQYLTSMTDANGNAAQLTYANNRLAKVTDGVGREITFTYDSESSLLTEITIPGCPAIAYSYSGEKLTGVRYGDINGENNTVDNTVYAYDGSTNMLVSASNYDGLQVRMTYESEQRYDTAAIDNFAAQARRVLSLETMNTLAADVQNGAGERYGSKQLFDYRHMTTRVTAVEQAKVNGQMVDAGKTLTYQFNNGGNVICVFDELGYAQTGMYSATVANQQTAASRLKRVVVNLLPNIDFASGWTTVKGASGDTAEADTSVRCLSLQTLKLSKTSAAETKHCITATVPSTGKYTFSAYVKNTVALASGGLFLRICSGNDVYESRPVTGTTTVFNTDSAADGWDRLYVTAELAQGENVTVELVSTAPGGSAWFACPQLEIGSVANHVNLLVNSDFTDTYTQGNQVFATAWGNSGGITDDPLHGVVSHAAANMPAGLSGNAMRIMSYCTTSASSHCQRLKISGNAGDVFVVGGWVTASSVASGKDKFKACLITRFKDTSGNWSAWQYNEYDPQRVGWKYGEWAIAAPSDYIDFSIGVQYARNTGTAMFTNIFVYREQYGESYVYDDDKNLISVATLSGKQSDIQYDNADNVKSYRQPGAASSAKYTMSYGDTASEQKKHLLLTSVTPMSMRDIYTYDSYGNRLTSTQQNSSGSAFIKAETTYTENGNYVATQKNARAKVVTRTVNETDGTLTSVTDPANNTVSYTYDAAKRVTGVQASGGTYTYRNAYTYENDRIKTVGHNTTNNDEIDVQYTFAYDALGRKTMVSVGNPLNPQQTPRTLSTNVYKDDRSGLLSEVNYGNGGKVQYTYDDFDRLTGVRYDTETTDRYTYEYGANGRASVVRDHHLGRALQTQYDLTERPMGTQLWEENPQQPSQPTLLYRTELDYDGQNRLAGFGEIAGGEQHKTEYTYDNDNRTTKVTYDDASHKVEYTYDSLGRVTQRVSTNGPAYMTAYTYVGGGYGTGSKTGLVSGITQGSDDNAMNFAYTYDVRGNITKETRNGVGVRYYYNALGELIRVNDPNDLTVGTSGTTWSYSYDRGGNITRKRAYPYTTGSLTGVQWLKNIAYTYWANRTGEQERLWKDVLVKCTETDYDATGAVVAGPTVTSFLYDGIGNMTSDGTWIYTWEAGRKLSKMSKTGMTVEYAYDHNGMRTQKKVTQDNVVTTTDYMLHGKLLMHLKQGSSELHFFYDASSRPVMVKYNGMMYTYVHNLQGDIVAILDNNGAKVVEYKYDAWGKSLATAGSMASSLGTLNPFRYRGYVYDEETGLYYLRSRYYSSYSCRFLSLDNLIDGGKSNGEQYCCNSPISKLDASGSIATSLFTAIDVTGYNQTGEAEREGTRVKTTQDYNRKYGPETNCEGFASGHKAFIVPDMHKQDYAHPNLINSLSDSMTAVYNALPLYRIEYFSVEVQRAELIAYLEVVYGQKAKPYDDFSAPIPEGYHLVAIRTGCIECEQYPGYTLSPEIGPTQSDAHVMLLGDDGIWYEKLGSGPVVPLPLGSTPESPGAWRSFYNSDILYLIIEGAY